MLLALLLSAAVPSSLPAQAPGAPPGQATDARRQQAAEVASMVDLAVTEYADAVRDGEIVNEMEYAESREFTARAATLFGVLAAPGAAPDVAAEVAARLDSLAAVVEAKGPVERYRALAGRVTEALAERWGAVSVASPDRRPSAGHGARLYRQACAACHGPTGRGDGRAARGMTPAPPDLTAPSRHAEATPARDYQVILYGIPETAMPSHRDWLSVEQAWDLVAYLQTLRHRAADVAEGMALALEGGPGQEGSPIAGRLRAWSSPKEVARLTDADLAERVRAAWDGAAGSTGTPSLSGEQVRSVVAYLRTLMGTPARGVPAADRTAELAASLQRADSLAVQGALLLLLAGALAVTFGPGLARGATAGAGARSEGSKGPPPGAPSGKAAVREGGEAG